MTQNRLNQKYIDICEKLNWNISEYEDETADLEKYSPAGEDFIFNVNINNFVNEVMSYATNFDIDEHITMWIEAKQNGISGIPSARELVYDAEAIDEMLQELAIELSGVK